MGLAAKERAWLEGQRRTRGESGGRGARTGPQDIATTGAGDGIAADSEARPCGAREARLRFSNTEAGRSGPGAD
ncbi:hypothetical protein NDU88_002152 [Pleurodeles waltl]|uniref:Uncharacterized protein n=1 Tax=Pleurodeles waltl TaxID=8319 RepID=A0AAV7T179_PLEWA|nr:hypothetical protein NDU88_002152 [Pleurodeles waltl]